MIDPEEKRCNSNPPVSGNAVDPTEKTAQIKPTVEMRNGLIDRRNSVMNKDLTARRSTRGVKPKPAWAVASRAIPLDERPVVMGGAVRGASVPTNPVHSVESHDRSTAPSK
jgi:hypothetical protein